MRSHRVRRALLAAGALILMTGCGSGDLSTSAQSPAAESEAMGHVHGLGVDPADDALYAATHLGVFRVGDDGSSRRIADRWQDTMAFTVVGPGHFLGSGHPDLKEDLPSHLGLIESVDAAETWSILSLGGEADFHALDVSGTRTYGYDATSGQLLTTTDRKNWSTVATGQVVDLAADPANPDRVIASAPDGTLSWFSPVSATPTALEGAPPLVLLDWPTAGLLVGVTAGGDTYRSEDGGTSWTNVGRVPGTPEAFDATERAWHVATDRGLFRSEDRGGTWTMLMAAVH